MPDALDFVSEVDDDGRLVYKAHRRRIAVNLKARAGGQVRIRISHPVRSPKQNNYYWAQLARISAAYEAAGDPHPSEVLHRWYKIRFLPVVAATLERETGEEVEYLEHYEFPDGTEERTYTTTRLSKDAFTLYVDMIRAEAEVELGVSLDEVPAGLRSGRIRETATEPLTMDDISALF